MSSQASKDRARVLILGDDAENYRPFLDTLSGQGVLLDFATTPRAALEVYQDHRVLLAQPDAAAVVIDNMPKIEWVQSAWAGIKPLLETRRNDYLLTGVKGIFGPQMAEYTLAHLLAHEQKLAERSRQQSLYTWWPERSGSLQRKTLGIMGTGSIGSCIARAARGLGLKVRGFNNSGTAGDDFDRVFSRSGLHEFLTDADYVVAVLPDTAASTDLMNRDSFAAMKPTALFINVGRGNLVVEADLVLALKKGRIAGAVLDVFRQEPLPADSLLWQTPGLVITGHVAAYSQPRDVAGIFLDNYQRFIDQQPLQYLIDRNRGY